MQSKIVINEIKTCSNSTLYYFDIYVKYTFAITLFRGFIYWKYQDRIIQKALKISRTFKISFHISTISMVKSDVGTFFIVSKYMNMFLLNIMLLISNTHNKILNVCSLRNWIILRKKSFKITITAE